MLLWLLRGCFLALMLVITIFTFIFFVYEVDSTSAGIICTSMMLLLTGIVVYTDLLEKEKHIATISSVMFGLILGLLVGWLFAVGMDAVLVPFGVTFGLEGVHMLKLTALLRMMITVIACYVSISTLMQTRDEFRFVIPYVEFSKQIKGGRPFILDTSVIIDGRIADLCEARIIDTRLVVPRFVLQELQGIADSTDKLKRNRGRRGLDILKRLQTNPKLDLLMHEGNIGEMRPGEKLRIDERLVAFAKIMGGRVVTNDFNLNKLAQLQGVEVINLNEVANALKTVALPGEYLQIKIVRAGDQIGQGVGYLDDGTMVVVENGRNLIGQEPSIVVTSVLQTPAGRMIFGRPEARPSGAYSPVSVAAPGVSGTGSPQPPPSNPGTGTHTPVGGKPPSAGTSPPRTSETATPDGLT
jgi:uncharacterized protein YacL